MSTADTVETFAATPPGTHPPLDSPDYRSSHLRHPNHDPLRLEPGKLDRSELGGPLFGEGTVTVADADLTIGPGGEAVGQRIIVTGRLLDAGAPMHEYRRVVTGGAPLSDALRARADEGKVAVVDAYGQSETWGGCVANGVPIPGVSAGSNQVGASEM